MKAVQNRKFIRSVMEDGTTVFTIEGLDNHPKAYKYTYERLINEIEKNKLKILSAGHGLPVVRVYPSLEIH